MPHRSEHVVIFEHRDFRGHHRHIFGEEANLNNAEDGSLQDAVSSFVVLSGTWQFFRDVNFQAPFGGAFGPGEYEFVGDFGIDNDSVSSLRAV
jgi:hypothetical protein